jgi:ribonuclease P protein component
LLTQYDFKNVFQSKNTRVSDGNWRIFSIKNSENVARLGLSIAKKSLNRAVDRNRCKRLVREFFRIHSHTLPQRDFIVMVNKSRGNKRLISNDVLKLELVNLFGKIK